MPAAAVIPAPIAYIKVVAAKRRESAPRRGTYILTLNEMYMPIVYYWK